jgi:hypothetical protein
LHHFASQPRQCQPNKLGQCLSLPLSCFFLTLAVPFLFIPSLLGVDRPHSIFLRFTSFIYYREMVSRGLMAVWSVLDVALLGAGVFALAMSIVWRAPDLLLNLVVTDNNLSGKVLALSAVPTEALTDLFFYSRDGSCYPPTVHICDIDRCHCSSQSRHHWSQTSQLAFNPRFPWHSRHWHIRLVGHFTRTCPLP